MLMQRVGPGARKHLDTTRSVRPAIYRLHDAALIKGLQLLTPHEESEAQELRRRLERYKAGKPYRNQPQGEHPKTGRE